MSAKLDSRELFDDRLRLRGVCETFLYREAELLDNRELNSWYELLTEDIQYRIPIRTTRERSADTEFSDVSFHMKEDRSSLRVRIERMGNDFAWSEDPPSRTRRNVSNVRIEDVDEDAGEVTLRDNLLVYLSRDDQVEPDLLSAERTHVLRRSDGSWHLAERTIHLDHTIVPTDSLTILL